MAISNVWHFVEDGKRAGPYTEEEMRSFVRQGRVRSETLVWCDGMTDWMPLHLSKGAALLLASEGTVSAPPVPGRAYSETHDTSARGSFGRTDGAAGLAGPGKPMVFFEAISSCFNKYVQFSGRASRSEYWYFWLFGLICSALSDMVEGRGQYGVGALSGLIALALVLPQLAVTARRLHDTDRSGWWMLLWLIPIIGWIVILVFLCQRPTPGQNRFG